jgi:hypothetical protein
MTEICGLPPSKKILIRATKCCENFYAKHFSVIVLLKMLVTLDLKSTLHFAVGFFDPLEIFKNSVNCRFVHIRIF